MQELFFRLSSKHAIKRFCLHFSNSANDYKVPSSSVTYAPQSYTYTLSMLAQHKSLTHWEQTGVGGGVGRPSGWGILASGERTGPPFPACSHLPSGTDLQIPPLEFGSFTMGPPAQGLTDARLEHPFLRFYLAPKSTRDRWGEDNDALPHLTLSLLASSRRQSHARSRPRPARPPRPPRPPPPHPQTRSLSGLRSAERPHPADCWAGVEGQQDKAAGDRLEALSGPGSRTPLAAGHAARGTAGPRKSDFSMKPQARCPAVRAPRRSSDRARRRAQTSSPPRRGRGARGCRVPAAPRRAHAARTRGARPRTLTRAAHSRCLGPHPCAKDPRAPCTR